MQILSFIYTWLAALADGALVVLGALVLVVLGVVVFVLRVSVIVVAVAVE